MHVDTPPPPPWKELRRIRADAGKVLRLFGLSRPPVDVFALAGWMGVRLEGIPGPVRPGSWSGELVVDDHGPVARYALEQPEYRQRFTIAHELGHLLLHDVSRAYRDTTYGGTPQEVEANRFAADLLMPLPWVASLADSYGNNVGRLARIFNVSEDAMSYRLGNVAGYR